MLKTLITTTLFVYLAWTTSCFAQVTLDNSKLPMPYSELKSLTGYAPSLLASEASALSVYRLLPTDIFKPSSMCYERAHFWSHGLDQHYSIKSMKVYLFFTQRYKREFDYSWTYHTAPIIPTVMSDGSIEDLVFDPTFTSAPRGAKTELYDNKPVTVETWTRYFIFPDVECKTTDNYQEVLDNQEAYYCYIMKAPMYNYGAQNFELDLSGKTSLRGTNIFDSQHNVRTGWLKSDVETMMKSLK